MQFCRFTLFVVVFLCPFLCSCRQQDAANRKSEAPKTNKEPGDGNEAANQLLTAILEQEEYLNALKLEQAKKSLSPLISGTTESALDADKDYSAGIKSLNVKYCATAFQHAFQKYVEAWADLVQVQEKHRDKMLSAQWATYPLYYKERSEVAMARSGVRASWLALQKAIPKEVKGPRRSEP